MQQRCYWCLILWNDNKQWISAERLSGVNNWNYVVLKVSKEIILSNSFLKTPLKRLQCLIQCYSKTIQVCNSNFDGETNQCIYTIFYLLTHDKSYSEVATISNTTFSHVQFTTVYIQSKIVDIEKCEFKPCRSIPSDSIQKVIKSGSEIIQQLNIRDCEVSENNLRWLLLVCKSLELNINKFSINDNILADLTFKAFSLIDNGIISTYNIYSCTISSETIQLMNLICNSNLNSSEI